MELSKFFNANQDSIPFSVKVVFFGAEELGLLGSKSYSGRHIQDTSSTIFYFNIDCVGDTGAILIDRMTGKRGECLDLPTDQLKAARDFTNSWNLSEPSYPILYESTIPDWLESIIAETINSTRHKYRKTRYCGSDHNSFANKGFVTIHMGFDGNNVQHCPEDNIKQVDINSLEIAGKVAAVTIVQAMKQYLKNTVR